MLTQKKYLFIDRDGTLIAEPEDQQVDHIDKLDFLPGVFEALSQLSQAGYELVMVSNQDGLGTDAFPTEQFETVHQWMLKIFRSQGIEFSAIHICPHLPDAGCECRKPKIGLLMDYVISQRIDHAHSYVIGDRDSDLQLAANLKIPGIKIASCETPNWAQVLHQILNQPRCARVHRQTAETAVTVFLDLDKPGSIHVETGIAFFNHMLEQLVKHAGISADIHVSGDLAVDDHHSVEDTAIALGEAMRQALGDKRGIARYGFVLPMDEAQASVSLDLSGRAFCQWRCPLSREFVGEMATEMVPHFFRSFVASLQATLHMEISGENTHHMVEIAFKALGRVLAQAIKKEHNAIPSTKGVL